MLKTMIISAFPACGKTYLYKNQEQYNYKILDSDSSKYEKQEGWEKQYVDNIVSNIGQYDFIFVAQYPELLKELFERKIPYVVVSPSNDEKLSQRERQLIKQQWFGRFVLRNNYHIKNLDSWLKELKENYDKWTNYNHLTKYNPSMCILLKENEYLSDVIEELYEQKENQ